VVDPRPGFFCAISAHHSVVTATVIIHTNTTPDDARHALGARTIGRVLMTTACC